MRIKQVIPVTPDYAVLATRKSDFSDTCYDQQDSGHSFFWAVMDEGYKDSIALIDVDVNGNQRICERRLVVPRKACPFCNQRMEPVYDNKHTPDFWQECPACGHVHDMRCHDEQEGGENDDE